MTAKAVEPGKEAFDFPAMTENRWMGSRTVMTLVARDTDLRDAVSDADIAENGGCRSLDQQLRRLDDSEAVPDGAVLG